MDNLGILCNLRNRRKTLRNVERGRIDMEINIAMFGKQAHFERTNQIDLRTNALPSLLDLALLNDVKSLLLIGLGKVEVGHKFFLIIKFTQ